MGYSLIKIIGVQGKKVDIIPTTKDCNATEVYTKKGEYLGLLAFDKRKKWNHFVLVDLHKDMQMSKDCIDEAFELTEEYWKNNEL